MESNPMTKPVPTKIAEKSVYNIMCTQDSLYLDCPEDLLPTTMMPSLKQTETTVSAEEQVYWLKIIFEVRMVRMETMDTSTV